MNWLKNERVPCPVSPKNIFRDTDVSAGKAERRVRVLATETQSGHAGTHWDTDWLETGFHSALLIKANKAAQTAKRDDEPSNEQRAASRPPDRTGPTC